MCVEVGRVRVNEVRDRLQTKTKHYNMILGRNILSHQRRVLYDSVSPARDR